MSACTIEGATLKPVLLRDCTFLDWQDHGPEMQRHGTQKALQFFAGKKEKNRADI
jgi:hypothetical protein